MGEAEQPGFAERVPARLIAAGIAIVVLALAGYWYASQPSDGNPTPRARSQTDSSAVVAPGSVVAPVPAVVAENEPASAGGGSSSAPPPPSGALRVEFDDRSWIEIRDATQKIVFVGEYPAGTRQNVEGKAPYQIWIGKASGVRLFVDERSIDLKPHIREEVARFTLE